MLRVAGSFHCSSSSVFSNEIKVSGVEGLCIPPSSACRVRSAIRHFCDVALQNKDIQIRRKPVSKISIRRGPFVWHIGNGIILCTRPVHFQATSGTQFGWVFEISVWIAEHSLFVYGWWRVFYKSPRFIRAPVHWAIGGAWHTYLSSELP